MKSGLFYGPDKFIAPKKAGIFVNEKGHVYEYYLLSMLKIKTKSQTKSSLGFSQWLLNEH